MKKSLFVVIPAYNEERYIAGVIKKTKKYTDNILVVDDGSADKTADTAENTGVTVLRHVINLGKGAALKTGAEYALTKGAKKLVFIDADGQHKPEDIPRFVEALKDTDVVFGSRKLNKKMPFLLKFGNAFINKISELLFRIKLRDTQSGFRAMTATAYKKIRWNSNSYSVESEMVARVGKKGLKYQEIDIQTIYSDRYKGTTVIDGIKIVLNMLWWKINRW
jgi:glycosyltransferase involved in cell wall biosynthesis